MQIATSRRHLFVLVKIRFTFRREVRTPIDGLGVPWWKTKLFFVVTFQAD